MIAVIFTLLGFAVLCFWFYLFMEEPLWAFHKWRIVRELHYNGDIDYTVEKNGCLGMPFLYQTEDILFVETQNITLESAKEIVSNREELYKKTLGKRVKKMEVVEL